MRGDDGKFLTLFLFWNYFLFIFFFLKEKVGGRGGRRCFENIGSYGRLTARDLGGGMKRMLYSISLLSNLSMREGVFGI